MLKRDRQPEILDDPELPVSEQQRALAGLSRLNRVSGIARAMYRRMRRYVFDGERTVRVLDIASGSGDIPIRCAKWAQREGLNFDTVMVDVSEVAAEQQRRRAQREGVSAESIVQDCVGEPLPGGFDLVTCSLFMHHLEDDQAIRLLQAMEAVKPRAILINDLDRSRFNLALVGFASRSLSRSFVVHHDAVCSVRSAYTRHEFRQLAERALLRPVSVDSLFPCRFVSTIDDQTVPVLVPAFA